MFKLRKILVLLLVTVIVLVSTGFTAQPAQAASCSSYHYVRWGESLSGIARYYGAYWPYLAQINGIYPPFTVYAGQRLCIAYGSGGYYPYNGDNNNYGAGNNGPGYPNSGIGGRQNYPYSGAYWNFSVVGVQQDTSVTINAYNFPSNVFFNVKIGRSSGAVYDWKDLPNLDTGNGGNFQAVINIPSEFKGVNQLVLRLVQAKKNGKVFQVDQWFSNVPGAPGYGGRTNNNNPSNYNPNNYNPNNYNQNSYNPYNYNNSGYGGYGCIPTIWIASVNRNSTVTVQTNNFPPNTDFQVLMGPMGTLGYGYYVSTFNSGGGGAMTLTFPIPPQLYGAYQVSIRTQNQWSGYYSYNWFYNNTTY
jgi:hypothetical protein